MLFRSVSAADSWMCQILNQLDKSRESNLRANRQEAGGVSPVVVKKEEPSPEECLEGVINRLQENPFTDISWVDFRPSSSISVDTSVENAL